MKLDSAYFDKVRAGNGRASARAASAPEPEPARACAAEGCSEAGSFRAPKGRHAEGEYHWFCLDHVREYNKTYNYFAGMNEAAVQSFQKDALTGHRPTWKVGVNTRADEGRPDTRARPRVADPFGMFGGAERQARPDPERRRAVHNQERRSFDMLGLPETATRAEVKARFHLLAKRYHPDANGGDRGNEDRLRDVIQAYNYLKAAGFA